MTRREVLALGGMAAFSIARRTQAQSPSKTPSGFQSLFDGVSLRGWNRAPRLLSAPSLGKWVVRDGMIIGGQEKPGLGSDLVTKEKFADFELQIEGRPDWPSDTGILVRTNGQGYIGFQVLFDYRPRGGMAGYYGNGLGNWIASDYSFMAANDHGGPLPHVTRLLPVKRWTGPHNHWVPLHFCAPAEVFLRTWKLNDWNQFRIRSVGAMPHLTTWINGVKITELNTAKIWNLLPGWDPARVLGLVGRAGHISLEVHSNGPHDPLGKERWWPGNVCRWRNICIEKL